MKKCKVCGGVTTCPAKELGNPTGFEIPLGLYMKETEYETRSGLIYWHSGWYKPLNGLPAERIVKTHWKKDYDVGLVKPRPESGRTLYTCGATQRCRVLDHWPEAPLPWCGQCKYATVVIQNDAPPIHYQAYLYKPSTGDLTELVWEGKEIPPREEMKSLCNEHKSRIESGENGLIVLNSNEADWPIYDRAIALYELVYHGYISPKLLFCGRSYFTLPQWW